MSDDRPVAVDLYCGQGGASMGLHRAGFRVIGVDKFPQPNYPFEFVQGDATELRASDILDLGPAVVTGSPPCQGETLLNAVNNNQDKHPRLIGLTRKLFRATGLPYVIENVVGATLIDPVRLCGEMFGLGVIRHRLFETNWPLAQPAHVKHRGKVRGWRHGEYFDGPYVAVYGEGGGKGTTAEWAEAMGIDWMTRDGLRESIPPDYTEYVGCRLLVHLARQSES